MKSKRKLTPTVEGSYWDQDEKGLVKCQLFVDHRYLLDWLGPVAARSKGGRSARARGAVVVKRIRE
jgi:hypothetical protein